MAPKSFQNQVKSCKLPPRIRPAAPMVLQAQGGPKVAKMAPQDARMGTPRPPK